MRYPVPQTIVSDVISFVVPVPNDAISISNFFGAIESLSKPSNYAWDTFSSIPFDQLRTICYLWLQTLIGLQVYMPIQFRVNPSDNAHWQYSVDSGATWINGPATGPTNDTIITDPTGIQTITQPSGQPLTVGTAIANLTFDIVSGLLSPPSNAGEAIMRVDKKLNDAIALLEVVLVP